MDGWMEGEFNWGIEKNRNENGSSKEGSYQKPYQCVYVFNLNNGKKEIFFER